MGRTPKEAQEARAVHAFPTYAELEEEGVGVSPEQVEAIVKELQTEGLSEEEVRAIVENSVATAGSEGLGYFNVVNYGAKGNGSTDDHEAIQKAIEAAEATNGGIIYFPPVAVSGKYYKTTSNFKYKLAKNIHFLGCFKASEIKLSTDLQYGECLFEEKGEEEATNNIKHRFMNLHLKGPEVWSGTPQNNHINGYTSCLASGFEACSQSQFYRCTAENFYAGFLLREFSQFFFFCKDSNCFYGRYVAPNNNRQPLINGGFVSYGHESGPRWARIAVHPSYISEGTTLHDEGGSGEPYYFYREAPQGVSGGFLQSAKGMGIAGQGSGHGIAYDESQGPTSYITSECFKEAANFQLYGPNINVKLNNENRIGNSQTLTITATGGTFTLTLPAQTDLNAEGTAYSGGTTAAISATATRAQIETAVKAVSGTTAIVTELEAKKFRIILTEKAAMMSGTAITVNTGSLTGGTATLGSLELDPNAGPKVRPVTPKKVEVKNATSGTFVLTVKIEGTEYKIEGIKYNESSEGMLKKVYKAMTAWNCVIGAASEAGKYYLFFNGRALGKTVEVTADASGLSGTSPEVVISNGAEAKLPPRGSEYPFDVGNLTLTLPEAAFAMESGTVGFIRAKVVERLRTEGTASRGFFGVGNALKPISIQDQRGNTTKVEDAEVRYKGAHYRLFKVNGTIEKGHLLALNGTSGQAVIFPSSEAAKRPACGFAALAVESGERWVPVLRDQPMGNAVAANLVEALYSGSAPEAFRFLKPSSSEDGKVEAASEAPANTVAGSLAAGSGGKVKIAPRGIH